MARQPGEAGERCGSVNFTARIAVIVVVCGLLVIVGSWPQVLRLVRPSDSEGAVLPTGVPTATLQADAIDPAHRAVIEAFVGGSDLPIQDRGVHSGIMGLVHEYETLLPDGDWAVVRVAAGRPEVCGFLRQRPRGAVQLTEAEAEQIALAFVKAHYTWFEETELTRTPGAWIQQDEDLLYVTHWVQVDPKSGALLPTMVHVSVNAVSGKVESCDSLHVETPMETEPAVSEGQAKEMALEWLRSRGAEGTVRDLQLAVSTVPLGDPLGELTLLWGITVVTEEEGKAAGQGIVTVVIDAQSGEVIGQPF